MLRSAEVNELTVMHGFVTSFEDFLQLRMNLESFFKRWIFLIKTLQIIDIHALATGSIIVDLNIDQWNLESRDPLVLVLFGWIFRIVESGLQLRVEIFFHVFDLRLGQNAFFQ